MVWMSYVVLLLTTIPAPAAATRDVQIMMATARIERAASGDAKSWASSGKQGTREMVVTLPDGRPVLLRIRDYE